jgi:hypothetical protein
MLNQAAIDAWQKLRLSILPFDEIEKASDALWQLLPGIRDKATAPTEDPVTRKC